VTSLSDLAERLPSLLLPLPATLLQGEPAGDALRYRRFYGELVAMGRMPDLRRLRGMAAQLDTCEAKPVRHGNARNDVQDWWFGTRRVSGDIFLIVLVGLVTAYVHALDDMQAQRLTLGRRKVAMLHGGLARMAAVAQEFLYRLPSSAAPRARRAAAAKHGDRRQPSLPRIPHPMQRWRCGHQLFFTSIQTLNMLFTMLRRAVDEQRWPDAQRHLDEAAFFMDLSARSIEYASNYAAEQYDTQVRPLMPPGFSGVMLADHEVLIDLLRQLRGTVFATPPPPIRTAVARFNAAMAACYDAHNLVCEAFVGKGPSLREIEIEKGDPQPATKVLEQFKRGRLKMLAPK
jgi:hypothetical protein